MANNGKGALVGTLIVLGLMGYACGGRSEPTPASSAPPLTVRSVETFADLTLSDGRRVHNTSVDSIASSVAPSTYDSTDTRTQKSCVVRELNRFAAANFVGRPVSRADARTISGYSGVTPMPGYIPVELRVVDGASPYVDVSSALSTVYSNASTACYVPPTYSAPETTTTTPTTTSEAPATEYADPDVYADAPDVDAPKRRSGQSGHPCLPGERDGDKDGYCGEGR